MGDRGEAPVYRPRRPGGIDPATRRLATIAGAIGAVLLLVVGGWSLSAHRGGGGVPVIEPLPGPLKVKPVNPGGLQVLGADPPPTGAGEGTETLGPAPERADPQALAAELARARALDAIPPTAAPGGTTGQPATAAKPAATAATGTAPPAPLMPAPAMSAASPGSRRLPGTPVPGTAPGAKPGATPGADDAAAASPAPVPAGATPSAPSTDRIEVQLAAMDSEALARAEWRRLQERDRPAFADRSPIIAAVSRDGRRYWRVRTGGFADVAAADAFCAGLRARRLACTVARF